MVGDSVRRQRRWRKPHIVSELSGFRLGQLQRFFRLLDTKYESALNFRGDTVPLFYDAPSEEIHRDYPNAERAVLPSWSLAQCEALQRRLRDDFGRMVEAAPRPGGYRVNIRERVLQISGWAQGDEVFRLSPLRGFPSDEDGVARLILGHVAGYIDGLRRKCIRKCDRSDCRKYFLDPAMREARHCSQACRYLAYEEEQRKPRRKKAGKKG
jgi:hypothetical protein